MSTPRSVADIAFEIYEKPLEPEELERRLREMLADAEERHTISELIAWFTRRYPTVEERLAYVRRHAKRIPREG